MLFSSCVSCDIHSSVYCLNICSYYSVYFYPKALIALVTKVIFLVEKGKNYNYTNNNGMNYSCNKVITNVLLSNELTIRHFQLCFHRKLRFSLKIPKSDKVDPNLSLI